MGFYWEKIEKVYSTRYLINLKIVNLGEMWLRTIQIRLGFV